MKSTVWFTPTGVFWMTASDEEPQHWPGHVEDFLAVFVQADDDILEDVRLLVVPVEPWLEDGGRCADCGALKVRLSMTTRYVAPCDCHIDHAERALGVE